MLGRLIAQDENDLKFPMKSILPEIKPDRKTRSWWANGAWYDQGHTSSCVGHGWAHYMEDGPITHKGTVVNPFDIYHEAQKVDEWEGENYDGTSVRAGAKVLQAKGLIKQYRWAFDVETVILAVLTEGPVVMGTYWYSSMFEPDTKGKIKVNGAIEGGHCYLINGVNRNTGLFRIKNSWGRGWGLKGHAFISFDDMAQLISSYGEACIAIENK